MRPTIVSACLLLTVAGGPALAGQSLGGLAAREQERRKAIQAPARVITENDLGPAVGPGPSDAQAPGAAADTSDAAARRVLVAPADFKGGALPLVPVMAVAGGEVVLEVSVSKAGRVTGVKPLRHTAPFTDALSAAVRAWTFAPAEDAPVPPAGTEPDASTRKPMDSTVLVVGLFRPPALFGVTLGEPPKDVGAPSGAAPVPMVPLEMPVYPRAALHDGVVMLELDVAAHGAVEGIGIVRSSPAFDQAAIGAASSLIFKPGRVHERPAAAHVYVVAAFRQPVTF